MVLVLRFSSSPSRRRTSGGERRVGWGSATAAVPSATTPSGTSPTFPASTCPFFEAFARVFFAFTVTAGSPWPSLARGARGAGGASTWAWAFAASRAFFSARISFIVFFMGASILSSTLGILP